MATTQRNSHKWQARRAALLSQQSPIKTLSAEACETRARYAAAVSETAYCESALITNDAAMLTLHCARTGAKLGKVDPFIFGQLAQMPEETQDEAYAMFHARRMYHPAWVNLTPAILAKLQTLFPEQFVVYAAHELQHDDDATDGAARGAILDWLFTEKDSRVCEAAELLRRVLAMVGHYRAQRQHVAANVTTPAGIDDAIATARDTAGTLPIIADFTTRTIADYIDALKAYFSAVVRRSQAETHVQSAYRQHQITFHDVRRINITLGRQQFKQARERTANIDNATFYDVAEIFADESDLTMAITAKQVESRKGMRYTGNVHRPADSTIDIAAATINGEHSDELQSIVAEIMAEENGEPQTVHATQTPAAAPVLKIRLFK